MRSVQLWSVKHLANIFWCYLSGCHNITDESLEALLKYDINYVCLCSNHYKAKTNINESSNRLQMIVFATLFVCGGVYTNYDVQQWVNMINDSRALIIVAGRCDLNVSGAILHYVPLGHASKNSGAHRYRYLHTKFHLWRLPFERVVYYDLDVFLKPPVDACARMCPSDLPFCAVRDPVATWPLKSKTYFNGGFLVLTPNKSIADALDALGADNQKFAEQDTLNAYFSAWYKLPKHCNWLHYLENHKNAKNDPAVRMVHHKSNSKP